MHSIPEWQATTALANDSDRAAGLVAAAMVENRLEAAIRFMTHADKKIEERMFHSSGPLGSFSAKIDLGFMIGIYGDLPLQELITIEDIRNRFAHRLDINSFSDQEIADRCKNLKRFEVYFTDGGLPVAPMETPTGEWSYPLHARFGKRDLAKHLQSPRERYIMSAQVYCYQLYIVSSLPRTETPPLF
jgi:hypothetical protein